MDRNKKNILAIISSILVFFIVWTVLAFFTHSELILPSPVEVLTKIISLWGEKTFWLALYATFLRCILSYVFSFLLAVFFGITFNLFPLFKTFMSFSFAIIKVTPVVSFILIAVFWFKTNTVPYFIATLMILPILTAGFTSAIGSVDSNLLEMAKVYALSKKQIIVSIYFPWILPLLKTPMLTAFSQTWKVVLAAEILCLPSKGIGSTLYEAKMHLETAEVFALTVSVIVLCFILENLFELLFAKLEVKK